MMFAILFSFSMNTVKSMTILKSRPQGNSLRNTGSEAQASNRLVAVIEKVASTDSIKEQKAGCFDEHIGEETGICTRQTFSGKKK
jgi:hypothetical protein